MRELVVRPENHKTNLYDSSTGVSLKPLRVFDLHEWAQKPTYMILTKDTAGPIVCIFQGGLSINYHVHSSLFEADAERLSRLFTFDGPEFVKAVRNLYQ